MLFIVNSHNKWNEQVRKKGKDGQLFKETLLDHELRDVFVKNAVSWGGVSKYGLMGRLVRIASIFS